MISVFSELSSVKHLSIIGKVFFMDISKKRAIQVVRSYVYTIPFLYGFCSAGLFL